MPGNADEIHVTNAPMRRHHRSCRLHRESRRR
jgi:hypothetical protein